jgi:hypothetical protein
LGACHEEFPNSAASVTGNWWQRSSTRKSGIVDTANFDDGSWLKHETPGLSIGLKQTKTGFVKGL